MEASKTGVDGLRSYPLKHGGAVVLACEKCQRRQRKAGRELGKLKKLVKKAGRALGAKAQVVNLPCLKLCPKDGVVVLTAEQLFWGECSIVRTEEQARAQVAALVGRLPARGIRLKDVQEHKQNDHQEQGAYPAGAVVAPGA